MYVIPLELHLSKLRSLRCWTKPKTERSTFAASASSEKKWVTIQFTAAAACQQKLK